jgi:hypothetical protein
VSLEPHGRNWSVRWDIDHPEVGEILHGKFEEPARVSYPSFITGWASKHEPPGRVVAHFNRDDVANKPELLKESP